MFSSSGYSPFADPIEGRVSQNSSLVIFTETSVTNINQQQKSKYLPSDYLSQKKTSSEHLHHTKKNINKTIKQLVHPFLPRSSPRCDFPDAEAPISTASEDKLQRPMAVESSEPKASTTSCDTSCRRECRLVAPMRTRSV